MAINIDWNLLRSPSIGSRYAEGQDERQKNMLVQNQLARQAKQDGRADIEFGQKQATFEREGQARAAASPYIAKGDYGGAVNATAGLDPELAASLAKLDVGNRARTKELSERGASVIMSALRLPGTERGSFIAQGLGRLGVDPAAYGDIDWTNDAALQAEALQALTVADHLAQANKDRDYGLATDTFNEGKRHNRATEGLGRMNANTSAFSANTGRLSYNARLKGIGGFGTPGGGTAGDTWEEF